MLMKRQATLDDLELVEGPAEIVNGKVVMKPRHGFPHSRAVGFIVRRLDDYEERTQLGYSVGPKTNYEVALPNRQSFCPDGSFYAGPPEGDDLMEGPLFAVEVRSAGDYGLPAERAMATKRAEYFAARTQVVWDVDLRDRCIRAYRADAPTAPAIFKAGDDAHAEPALPGWRMRVDEMLKAAFPLPKQ
jgi:Uma2 family endonuclease